MEAALRTTDGAGEGWEEAMGAAAAGEGNVLRTPSGGVLRFAEQREVELWSTRSTTYCQYCTIILA